MHCDGMDLDEFVAYPRRVPVCAAVPSLPSFPEVKFPPDPCPCLTPGIHLLRARHIREAIHIQKIRRAKRAGKFLGDFTMIM